MHITKQQLKLYASQGFMLFEYAENRVEVMKIDDPEWFKSKHNVDIAIPDLKDDQQAIEKAKQYMQIEGCRVISVNPLG